MDYKQKLEEQANKKVEQITERITAEVEATVGKMTDKEVDEALIKRIVNGIIFKTNQTGDLTLTCFAMFLGLIEHLAENRIVDHDALMSDLENFVQSEHQEAVSLVLGSYVATSTPQVERRNLLMKAFQIERTNEVARDEAERLGLEVFPPSAKA